MSDASLRERFGKLLDHAGHMFWEVDRNYVVRFANETLRRKFGDPVGKTCHEFMAGHDGLCEDCAVQRIFNGAERAVSERARKDKDGREVWLEHTATPIKNAAGEIIGAGELTIDITKRRETEEWVKDSERLYRNLVEQSPDTIFSLDPEGRILFVNTQIEQFLGYSVQQLLETPMNLHIDSGDLERWKSIYRLGPQEIWDEEVSVVAASGQRKFARIRCKAIYKDGALTGFEGVLRDRTVRRKLEEELRTSKEALVEKIRIIDELYEHIVQSGRCKAIEEHTAEVAHELRQPLAIVGGFARRMARQFETDDVNLDRPRQYTNIIVTEVQRLERILDGLIDFTKRNKLQLRKISPNELIEYILKVVENRIAEKRLKLEVNIGTEVGEIPLDPGRFQQLVLNLVSNAIEASPIGGVIELETGVSIPSDKAMRTGKLAAVGFFEMKIKNQGPSISKEALQKVFNPFFTTKSQGTGLGLTVTKKIVEDHRGTISVKSNSEGTLFTIWLPLVETTGPAPQMRNVSESAP